MPCRRANGASFAIASGAPEATEVAAQIMLQGGTVVDATLAGSAVLCVTSPHAVSIGGDLFALISRPGAPPLAVNGTGGAPRAADIDRFRALGHGRVPVHGALSIQTPGLVAAWQSLLPHCRFPLARLLEPAVALAREGFCVGARLSALIEAALPEYAAIPGFAEAFLHNGRAPRPGALLRQARLARTLEIIAAQGTGAFYHGPIAADIAGTVTRAGGLLSTDDFAGVSASVAPSMGISFAGHKIWTQPPISQGVVLLRALSLIETGKGAADDSAGGLARAFCQTFDERLAILGDEAGMRIRAEEMLAGQVRTDRRPMAACEGPDTTTICAIDRDGNAASLILSVFADFGSGIVGEETGILLNNRLSGFFLDPSHPNALAPGRRTMHTLHSVFVEDTSGIKMAGGSPGGDNQPQVNAQILTSILAHKEDAGTAVEKPRWAVFPGTIPADLASRDDRLIRCEPGLPDNVRLSLEQTGLQTENLREMSIGSAKWSFRDSDHVEALSDTRRDGAVAAY